MSALLWEALHVARELSEELKEVLLLAVAVEEKEGTRLLPDELGERVAARAVQGAGGLQLRRAGRRGQQRTSGEEEEAREHARFGKKKVRNNKQPPGPEGVSKT